MDRIKNEILIWSDDARNLIEIGRQMAYESQDYQRKKLVYYILNEVAVQCQEIQYTGESLLKMIQELEDFMDGMHFSKEKYKQYPR